MKDSTDQLILLEFEMMNPGFYIKDRELTNKDSNVIIEKILEYANN